MRACPRCGEENPERARFCLNCGEPLAEAEERRRERKFATTLFADLVGSTSLAEREDPEVVHAVVAISSASRTQARLPFVPEADAELAS